MKKWLLALLLLPALAFPQATTSWTFHWDPVVNAFDGTPLPAGTAITYNVYTSPGCGQKALQSTTSGTSVTVPVGQGCTSAAVSASDSAGEGAISSTITIQVAAPLKKPAQVINIVSP